MNIQEQLAKWGDLYEVAEVKSFRAYKSGTNVEVQINVFDYGPNVGPRYAVEAFDAGLTPEDRHQGSDNYTFGNADNDLGIAIANAHWNQIGA